MRENYVFFGGGNVFFQFVLVGSVKVKGAAQPHELDGGIGKAALNLLALRLAQGDLHFVSVPGPQFHALKMSSGAVFDDRVDVPILGQIVGHGADLHAGRCGEETRLFACCGSERGTV